jgi:hypothetical protein
MTNQLEATLEVLEHVMCLAHHAVFEGPVDDAELVADLCSMLAAVDKLVRDYRNALADLNDDIPF